MHSIVLRGFVLVALSSVSAVAQVPGPPDSLTRSRAEFREAVRAYEAKDYAAYLRHARLAQALRPAHGGVTYTLASAYAPQGEHRGRSGVARKVRGARL